MRRASGLLSRALFFPRTLGASSGWSRIQVVRAYTGTFRAPRKSTKGQLELLCKACFYKDMSSYDYVHFLRFLFGLIFTFLVTRTKRWALDLLQLNSIRLLLSGCMLS